MSGRNIFSVAMAFILLFMMEVAHAQWARTLGGESGDWANSIQRTSDGGFIVAGATTSFGAGSKDAWIVKLDAYGDVEWQKTYGGWDLEEATSVQQTADGGYIVAGWTGSFGNSPSDVWVMKLTSGGDIEWQKIYGGGGTDWATSVQQTPEGGYIVAGWTESFGAGYADIWVLKLDERGDVSWQKTYGGGDNDRAYSILRTSDGGYIVAGETQSFGDGAPHVWILKLQGNGDVSWQKTYEGDEGEHAYSVQQTTDGGYIVAGEYGGDPWVLKLDSTGAIQWQRSYTGRGAASSVQQTPDGGYIISGSLSSSYGDPEAWLLKLDSHGNVSWQRTYGGSGADWASYLQETGDGGYMVAGLTYSFGAGDSDLWLLKVDGRGDIYGCPLEKEVQGSGWETNATVVDTHGVGQETNVSGQDSAATITVPTVSQAQQCSGGGQPSGYTLTVHKQGLGRITSYPEGIECGDVCSAQFTERTTVTLMATPQEGYVFVSWMDCPNPSGTLCTVVMNTDREVTAIFQPPSSQPQWAKALGGYLDEHPYSIQGTTDGGAIVAGETKSFGAGRRDAWVLKLKSDGSVQWQKTYGGEDDDFATSIRQTPDGGYIVAGCTYSFGAGEGDFWVLKLDGSGNVVWQKTYGGSAYDWASSIMETPDGGYVVAGITHSFGNGGLWVLKLNSNGHVVWQKVYGVASATSLQVTTNGGIILAGGMSLLKLDENGVIQWTKSWQGLGDFDDLTSVTQTPDGGYMVTGSTVSYQTSSEKILMIKLNGNGEILWQKAYGGSRHDGANALFSTSDGGCVIAGFTSSFGTANDYYDISVLKMDGEGNVEWGKTFGGEGTDVAFALSPAQDGGYVVAGYTDSFGAGEDDFWVLKLSASGDIQGGCPLETGFIPEVTDISLTEVHGEISEDGTNAVEQESNASISTPPLEEDLQCEYPFTPVEPQVNSTAFRGGEEYSTNHLELAFVRPQTLNQPVDLYISLTQPAAEGGSVTYYFQYANGRVALPNGIYFNNASPTIVKAPYCTNCTMPDSLQLYGPSDMSPIFNDGWVIPHPFTMADGVESCQYLPDGSYIFTLEAYGTGTDDLLAKGVATVILDRGCD